MAEIKVPKPNSNNPIVRNSLTRDSQSLTDSVKPKEKTAMVYKEPSLKEKIRRSFIKEDMKSIRDYIVIDVIIPTIKQSIFDAIVGTVGQIFGIRVPRYTLPRSYMNYSSSGYSPNTTTLPHQDFTSIQRPQPQQRYSRFYVTDFVFTNYDEACKTLERMTDICDANGWVSVAQFFSLADPEGSMRGRNPYTNDNFGWSNIDRASVVENAGGWSIDLPPAQPRRMNTNLPW